MIKHKKGRSELGYLVFLVVFILFMSFINEWFLEDALEQKVIENKNSLGYQIMMNLLNLSDDLPLIGQVFRFFLSPFTAFYVNPYLGLFYAALFGIPVGYILLRLIRGGG